MTQPRTTDLHDSAQISSSSSVTDDNIDNLTVSCSYPHTRGSQCLREEAIMGSQTWFAEASVPVCVLPHWPDCRIHPSYLLNTAMPTTRTQRHPAIPPWWSKTVLQSHRFCRDNVYWSSKSGHQFFGWLIGARDTIFRRAAGGKIWKFFTAGKKFNFWIFEGNIFPFSAFFSLFFTFGHRLTGGQQQPPGVGEEDNQYSYSLHRNVTHYYSWCLYQGLGRTRLNQDE